MCEYDFCQNQAEYWTMLDGKVCQECMEREIEEGARPEDFEPIINYVSDCQGKIDTEIYGYFQHLASPNERGKTVFCLVADDSDIQTISDLVLTCGYTEKSLLNKQVMISIVEND